MTGDPDHGPGPDGASTPHLIAHKTLHMHYSAIHYRAHGRSCWTNDALAPQLRGRLLRDRQYMQTGPAPGAQTSMKTI